MLAKVIVHNGQIINLGDWDFQIENQPIIESFEEGEPVYKTNDKGELLFEKIVKNPMPEGAEMQEIEIEYTADGRIVMANDYRELRKPEYPSIGDQLDALWKGGTASEEMKAMVMAIKEKYPKTE